MSLPDGIFDAHGADLRTVTEARQIKVAIVPALAW